MNRLDEIHLGSDTQTFVPYGQPLEPVLLELQMGVKNFEMLHPIAHLTFFLVGVKDSRLFLERVYLFYFSRDGS
jgi:hypothetical protein